MKLLCLTLPLLMLAQSYASPLTWPDPPKWQEKARMARYLAHYAEWGVVAAISPEYDFMPFGSVQSFADGPMDNSSGIPYFYVSPLSDTYHNIKHNNSVSLSISLAESDYCAKNQWDPEEPLCARMILFGKMEAVTSAKEEAKAKQFLFKRHPAMATWPSSHKWSVFRLTLSKVCLLDFYGGATIVSLDDYFSAKP